MAEDRFLTVLSPAGAPAEVFKWVNSQKGEIRDENAEIVDIIDFICKDVQELSKNCELMEALEMVNRASYEDVSNLCTLYNRAIDKHLEEWSRSKDIPAFLNKRASKAHVQFILLQCYNRAVAEPDKLNQYPPFSPQVYGETSFELISQMIETVKITSDDSFIDLGSGVGQVVLQVSASSDAKFCYGIEKAEYPALCAANMDAEFRRWMSFYGKSYRPYMLERGDFLSPECHERIATAGVLFANNFAFGPEVDHQLKQRFANLKEGARIISSKAFCPLNFRITDRNLGDIGSIMHVDCLNPIQDAVSWTDKPFSYYVHTIDRSLLERYFSRLKNPKLKDDSELVRRDRKGRIISEQTLKDGFSATSTNTSDRLARSRNNEQCSQSIANGSRNRRSRSLNSAVRNGQPRTSTPSQLERSRTKGHVSDSAGQRRRVSTSHARRQHSQRQRAAVAAVAAARRRSGHDSGRSYSLRATAKLNQSNTLSSTELGRTRQRLVMNDRLASLSLNADSGVLFSSASESNLLESCVNRGGSGHTTPSGSTSLSSVGYSTDEINSVTPGPDSDKALQPGFARYSSPSDDTTRASHYNVRPVGWTSSSASSSTFAPSLTSSASSSSSVTRSPPLQMDGAVAASSSIPEPATDSDEGVRKDAGQPPIRITLSLSATKVSKLDRSPDNSSDKTLTPGPEPKPEVDTSVARRRAVRKCRQLSQLPHSSVNGSMKFRTAGVRKQGRGRTGVLCSHRCRQVTRRSLAGATKRSGASNETPTATPRTAIRNGPGRGRAESRGNLDVLHSETVSQIRVPKPNVNRPQPQYGLNDPAMAAFTCHYKPVELRSLQSAREHALQTASDANIGYSGEAVPLALTQYLELTKRAFMDHFAMLRSPAYADTVREQVTVERARQADLLARTRTLEDNIQKLHADGCDLLRNFTKRLGILISTPSAFFAQARKLIKHHHTLESRIAEFRKEISQLSSANQDLVRRHQVEAARLLSTALHTSQPSQSRHSHMKRDKPTICTDQSFTSPIPPVQSSPAPPCLTQIARSPGEPHANRSSHSTKPRSGHKTRRSLPRLSPQSSPSSIPASTHAPILFRSPEQPAVHFETYQNIPPPPPLVPMHNHLPPFSSSSKSDDRSSPGQIHQPSYLTSPLNIDHSLGLGSRAKSMHASLQDLIIDEFSRPKSNSTATSNNSIINSMSIHTNEDEFASATSVTTTTSSPAHVCSLPPRKRAWSMTDQDHSVARKYSCHQSPISGQAFPSSPPTLSPVAAVSPDERNSDPVVRAYSTAATMTTATTTNTVYSLPTSTGTSVADEAWTRGTFSYTSCGLLNLPPPLLYSTEYTRVSSSSSLSLGSKLPSPPISLPSLTLVATSALRS